MKYLNSKILYALFFLSFLLSLLLDPPAKISSNNYQTWLNSLQERLRIAQINYDFSTLPNITLITKFPEHTVIKANQDSFINFIHILELIESANLLKYQNSNEANLEVLSADHSFHFLIPEHELKNNIRLHNLQVLIEHEKN